jgi:predicted amidohydrolase YtcJ
MSTTDGAADLVLTGGHVHTVDPLRPRAEAVAVRGERIVAVGSAAEIGDGRVLLTTVGGALVSEDASLG